MKMIKFSPTGDAIQFRFLKMEKVYYFKRICEMNNRKNTLKTFDRN